MRFEVPTNYPPLTESERVAIHDSVELHDQSFIGFLDRHLPR